MVTNRTQPESRQRLLERLAELYGVQATYRDAFGRTRSASRESLIRTLLALGAEVNSPAGLQGAIRRREAEVWARVFGPVVVAWEGEMPALTMRVPDRPAFALHLTLTLEDGTVITGDVAPGAMREAAVPEWSRDRGRVALRIGSGRLRAALGLGAGRLPMGRHRLRVEGRGVAADAWVLAAPRRCWQDGTGGIDPPPKRPSGARLASPVFDAALGTLAGKEWGLFVPTYALRSERDWGAGDLADLAAVARWTGEVGGSLLATLPLLASSFGEDRDPSPYRPISRLFWNEFFLAPDEVYEWTE